MKNVFLFFLLFLSAVTGMSAQGCPDTVRLQIDTTYDGTDLLVRVSAQGFADIVSVQGALRYDADVFRILEVSSPLPGFGPGSWADNANGTLRLLWYQPTLQPVTLADGSEWLTLRMEVRQPSSSSWVGFTTRGYALEFSNSNLEVLCVDPVVITASGNGYRISGRVVNDMNKNCMTETTETGLQGWILEMEGNGKIYYRTTDEEGNYTVIVPAGDYTVRVFTDNALWSLCAEERQLSVTNSLEDVDFHASAEEDCYRLVADISTAEPYLTPCTQHQYTLVYENRGTRAAENSYIEVEMDEDLTFLSANLPGADVSGQVLTLPLGTLLPGTKGYVQLLFSLGCDLAANEAVCITAQAFPFLPCEQDPAWTGARLELEAGCDTGSGTVTFSIRNAGTGPMSSSRSYIVTEDDVLRPPRPFQLAVGEAVSLSFPADGTTYRLTADQDAGFPFLSTFVTEAVEGCTANAGAAYSTGFVTLFEESDRDPYIDTECREVRRLTERVTIAGSPKGYNAFHKYIEKTTHLEYTITFRHSGLDTVRQITVKNNLPDQLDVTTLRMGAGSHAYSYRLNQERELVITFDSLLLVSGGDTAGFVKYSIVPDGDVRDGDIIYNDADVVFGLEERVAAAAREKHTIGSNFVVNTVEWSGRPRQIRLWPNPVAEVVYVEGESGDSGVRYSLCDEGGRQVLCGELPDPRVGISVASLPPGGYVLRLTYRDGTAASAAIVK